MYEYKYDAETGGIILTDTTSLVSKEPRPVYAQELDYLGVDDYLIYEKQQDVPYMWAEAARYIYKRKRSATLNIVSFLISIRYPDHIRPKCWIPIP